MQTEFESKILEVNVEDVAARLEALGAVCFGEKMQRRLVYDFTPANENSWIRLRSNGEKATLAVKEIQHDQIDGTKELEIIVDDFDKTNLLLEKLGYIAKNYQENKRISYKLGEVEIEIDSWPQIPPYLEVEGKSIEEVEKALRLLGYSPEQATSINTRDVYKKYGIDVFAIKELKF